MVRRFLLSTEHHKNFAVWVELDHHVRAFVGDPNIVFAIDAHHVRIGPGVEMLAHFPNEIALTVKLEQLAGCRRVSWPGGVATVEHEDMPLGVHRHATHFAKVHIRR